MTRPAHRPATTVVRRTAAASIVAAGLALVVGVGAASAHIAPDPLAVQAGTAATVGFLVEHGCAGSNTSALDIKIPDSVTDAKPVDKAGWTATIDGGVVHFTGGDLDAKTADTFSIAFTAPATAGTIDFPIVQKCAVGETDWIDVVADGQPEPEHPAPALLITAGAPTAAELTPVPDEDADATEGSTPTGTDAPTAVAPTTVVPVTTAATTSDDSSSTRVVVGIIIAVVVVGAAGGAVYTLRKKRGGGQA